MAKNFDGSNKNEDLWHLAERYQKHKADIKTSSGNKKKRKISAKRAYLRRFVNAYKKHDDQETRAVVGLAGSLGKVKKSINGKLLIKAKTAASQKIKRKSHAGDDGFKTAHGLRQMSKKSLLNHFHETNNKKNDLWKEKSVHSKTGNKEKYEKTKRDFHAHRQYVRRIRNILREKGHYFSENKD